MNLVQRIATMSPAGGQLILETPATFEDIDHTHATYGMMNHRTITVAPKH
jgi:hypothetical protein